MRPLDSGAAFFLSRRFVTGMPIGTRGSVDVIWIAVRRRLGERNGFGTFA
jgi:hypothetical protein